MLPDLPLDTWAAPDAWALALGAKQSTIPTSISQSLLHDLLTPLLGLAGFLSAVVGVVKAYLLRHSPVLRLIPLFLVAESIGSLVPLLGFSVCRLHHTDLTAFALAALDPLLDGHWRRREDPLTRD